jgi:hypothetical protein
MVDRLRAFLNRPLRDADRRRLFGVAAAVVMGAAALFALLDDAGSAPARPEPSTAPRPSPPPAEDGRPPAAPGVSRRDVVRAKRAARRFLAGYLAYSYGRGRASEIENAGADLRRRLSRDPPRVPRREARRRPRVVLLHADGVGRMLALVSDGARRYTVALELAHGASGWRVVAIGS